MVLLVLGKEALPLEKIALVGVPVLASKIALFVMVLVLLPREAEPVEKFMVPPVVVAVLALLILQS